MIEISHLSYSYHEKKVLDNLNFQIQDAEFVTIIGPSGCGKTTLLKICAGLLKDYQGEIKINNQTPGKAARQIRSAYFFQKANLLPWRTVSKNISLPLEISHEKDSNKLEKILNLVSLQDFQDYYPHQISGGMQQKTALARGLIFDPQILFMDEPFASLDEITREKLGEELLKIWQTKKPTVLFVTHSISEAAFLSDRVIILSRDGSVRQIMKNNVVRPRNFETRKTPAFFSLCNELRQYLA